ncbi:hypothetical protein IJ095_00935 [Candidatus Saccharibacteria bacterium]|nr:hypothetical protein [Candidatus Saccharibacteria bacterium]
MSQDTYAAGVGTLEELNAALCAGGEITLTEDIYADSWLAPDCSYVVSNDVTIDFNGHKITSAPDRGYNLDVQGATLTLDDSGTGGGYFQMQNEGETTSGIAITDGKMVLNGGTIDGGEWVVLLWHDSELEMNGGTIHASTGFAVTGNGTTNPEHKNYGSNVKIVINGGEIVADDDFAIYNPSENSTIDISGDAMITGAAGAIAANRGTITINGGTLEALGTAEAEGDVSQDGSRGYTNAVIGIPKEYGPVTLNITDGVFVAEKGAQLIANVSGLDNENEATVTISGGVFSAEPKHSYVVEGKDIFQTDEGYVVENKINLPTDGSMAITLFKGESFDVGFELDKRGKYARLIADDSGLYTVDGMTITAGDNIGSAKYKVNYGGLIYNQEPEEYDVEIVEVPEVEVVADEELGLSDETMTEIAEKVKGILEGKVFVAEDGTKSWVSEDGTVWVTPEYAKEMVLNGEALRVEVWSEEILVDELDEEGKAQLNEMLEEGDTVVSLHDIELVIVSAEGYGVGGVDELSEPVTLTFAVPEEMREAPEGYTRKFYVIRHHYNRTAGVSEVERIEAEFDGENATIQNDKFSEFILTYQDVEETETAAPDTGRFTKPEDYAERVSQRTRALVTMLSTGMLMMGYGMLQLGFGYRNKE